jgi:hypothetical protein
MSTRFQSRLQHAQKQLRSERLAVLTSAIGHTYLGDEFSGLLNFITPQHGRMKEMADSLGFHETRVLKWYYGYEIPERDVQDRVIRYLTQLVENS